MISSTTVLLATILTALGSGGAAGATDGKAMYEVKAAEAKVAVGAKATTSLTITAKNGWHVNEEGPMSLTLTADPGISLAKAKLTRGDLAVKSKEAPRFDIAFTAGEAGRKSINAEARFIMCQETACKPVKEKLAMLVEVAAAPAPAAPAKARKR